MFDLCAIGSSEAGFCLLALGLSRVGAREVFLVDGGMES